eukprot:1156850-Pelagomonas_calceolata.AAC.18
MQARTQRASGPDPRDPATTAVAMAMSDPSSASYIKTIITRCEQLTLPVLRTLPISQCYSEELTLPGGSSGTAVLIVVTAALQCLQRQCKQQRYSVHSDSADSGTAAVLTGQGSSSTAKREKSV